MIIPRGLMDFFVVSQAYLLFPILDNIKKALEVIQRFSFMPIANAFVSVDSFFLLSGLLAGYLTFKKLGDKMMSFRTIPLMYLHRYIRLTPSLLVAILLQVSILGQNLKNII